MSYISKMTPYAKKAEQLINGRMDWKVILTQWVHETGHGRSVAARKHNNHAGIKDNSRGADYDGGTYAGYNSIDSFVRDWARVFSLPHYDNIQGGSIEKQISELHKSPWAEDPRYDSKMLRVYKSLNFKGLEGVSIADLRSNLEGAADMLDDQDLKKYATVGLATAVIISILS